MTSKERERLECLGKRLNHLRFRILQHSDKDLSYDKQEASALEWAIAFITGALS